MVRPLVIWFIAITEIFVLCSGAAQARLRNVPPVADAGPSRYVATEPIRLDGTGSYDPDGTPIMGYTWTQVSGPALAIVDADTPTPAVSGFVQTDAVQPCVVGLVVSDGRWLSPPARVELSIVPEFGSNRVELYCDAFDSDKPTIIYYGGGDCSTGYGRTVYGSRLPQPPELLGPTRLANGRGVRLSCRSCRNAVLYQHLFGSTPDGIDDYAIVAQAVTPPIRLLTSLPYPQVWWTVRVRDKYGSTIHADPIRLDAKSLHLPIVPPH